MIIFVQADGVIQSSCKHAQSTDSQGKKCVQPLGIYPSMSFIFIDDMFTKKATALVEMAKPIFQGRIKKAGNDEDRFYVWIMDSCQSEKCGTLIARISLGSFMRRIQPKIIKYL
jgi:hypothetical protein